MADYIGIHINLNTDIRHQMSDYIGIHITSGVNMRCKTTDYIEICITFVVVCSLNGRRRYVVGGIEEPTIIISKGNNVCEIIKNVSIFHYCH